MTADATGPAGPDPKAAAMLSSIVERDLTARVSSAQRRWRSPGVSAGVVRDGELVWTAHVGAARLGDGADGPGVSVAATDSTQFMIGSVTKTFTALAVMALRDAGRLSLDDPLDVHVP
ncbi:MAG TPA: serine hydrolase domain-containing protein, partial [Intrasporangium sp.]|nr:serine hydrolase domain-containing protein [Intrasporangium sp.]